MERTFTRLGFLHFPSYTTNLIPKILRLHPWDNTVSLPSKLQSYISFVPLPTVQSAGLGYDRLCASLPHYTSLPV